MTTSNESRRHREIVDVALPHAAMAQARALDARARQQQHVEREIDAEPALDVAGRTFPACGRCRCRDRAASGTAARRARRGSRSPPPRRRHAACGCGPIARHARGNNPAPPRRAPRAPRTAARGRARAIGSEGSSRATSARASSALPPRSARRKNAQAPSRKRSTSPASTSSLRWREMRGCDCRRICGEIGHGQFGLGQQHQDAQPRVLAGRLERGVEGVERQVGRHRSWEVAHHIKISLYG